MAQRSVRVEYFIQAAGALPADTSSAFLLPASECNLETLRRAFPFEGKFHFRCRERNGADYVWRDLLRDEQQLNVTDDVAYVKVLPLQEDDEETEDGSEKAQLTRDEEESVLDFDSDMQIFHTADKHGPEVIRDPGAPFRREKTGPYGGLTALKSVSGVVRRSLGTGGEQLGRTAKGFYQTVVRNRGRGAGGAAPASPQAGSQLGALRVLLQTTPRPQEPEHEILLQKLWLTVGFSSEDPWRDIPSMLSLRSLVFLYENCRDEVAAVLSRQDYPLASVGSQLCHMLGDVLRLEGGNFNATPEVFWELFQDPMAFYELYVLTLRVFDQLWQTAGPVGEPVRSVVNSTQFKVTELLSTGPQNIADLRELYAQTVGESQSTSISSAGVI